MNTFIRSSEAFAVIRCIDRNERAIVGVDGKPLTLCNIEMSLAGPRPIPFGLRYQRPRQIFGRYGQFYHDSILVDVPKDLWRKVAYVELDMFTGGLHSEAEWQDESSTADAAWIRLEMSQKKLVSVGKETLFLLISKVQAARRMEKIIREQPVLLGRDQAVMVGLSSLMVKLFRGGDGPLLTEGL
ncbi:MAG: hypothetical protein R3C17_08920 [Planctomycetaceae bacterium]